MDDGTDHEAELDFLDQQERVVVEDYHGPASGLPPSSPSAKQTAIPTKIKQDLVATSQADSTTSRLDWLLVLSKVGLACGLGSGMFVFSSTIFPHPYILPHPSFFHDVLYSIFGVVILCISIIGVILCTRVLIRYRLSNSPHSVLNDSRTGLALNGMALLVFLLGYIFGW